MSASKTVAELHPTEGRASNASFAPASDVFRLIARGLSNGEIAQELFISETTVKTHITHVLQKLGVRDRVQAVVLAYESGVAVPGQTP
jgi:DNA-binding NarL/FixJ family response regulator